MKQRVKRILGELDFIRNYPKRNQSTYIRLKVDDYQLIVDSLPYFQQQRAKNKGHFDYRDFTVIPEKE